MQSLGERMQLKSPVMLRILDLIERFFKMIPPHNSLLAFLLLFPLRAVKNLDSKLTRRIFWTESVNLSRTTTPGLSWGPRLETS